ncbi:MAG: xanthine dehydrogenase family protein molybdopterin-binding subunit [Pseudomonadota bacterium]|nr:xanthine dehydrogenase family protein molybdopterin-binding subunit [Pseudomonadota bacterium]
MNGKNLASGIGRPVQRKEDFKLLTGCGRYTTDVAVPRQTHAAFVRSPHAHARIHSINTRNAEALQGVLLVLTAAELVADGLSEIPCYAGVSGLVDLSLNNSDGTANLVTPLPILASDRTRFVGDPIAAVIAETYTVALEAAELIEVIWEPLEHITTTQKASKPGAVRVWDHIPDNVCVDGRFGVEESCQNAFDRAHHTVSLRTPVQRVTGVMLETRAALADYDTKTGRITVYCGGDNSVRLKQDIASAMGLGEESLRVIAGDVGGNYGTRNWTHPEYVIVAHAAKKLNRAVRWQAQRSEAFLSDYHGRDNYTEAELALDAEGNFIALRAEITTNNGAHTVAFVPLLKTTELLPSVYRFPTATTRGRAVTTNTSPTTPYRSAGRPEAMFVMERLIDIAARKCGFDSLELRRRNLIRTDEMPYETALGLQYDSGNFLDAMDRALALGAWDTFPARKSEAETRGKLRGIGFANYIEITSGFPFERAEIHVHPGGTLDVVIGTTSSGQGHETTFAQCVAEWLGVPFRTVKILTGDTDVVSAGGGSHSARSMRMAGIVMGRASEQIIANGRAIAAHVFEAPLVDVGFVDGNFVIRGTDRSIGIFEVARIAETDEGIADHLKGPLQAASDELMKNPGFPYGAQVCEIEIDPETGTLEIMAYAAVDDVGHAVNPMILHGQTHGGMAQGAGQALLEHVCYDPADGQLITGSLLDYALPRADVFPSFVTDIMETPSPTNPLGIRGGGEGGTTPALAVVINAIVDALAAFGVLHVEMPATPERIWRLIQAGKANP